jgi:uncharacterized FlgJ-related protein
MHKRPILLLIFLIPWGLSTTLFSQSLIGIWKSSNGNVSYHFRADSSIIYRQDHKNLYIKKFDIKSSNQPNILLLHINQGRKQLLITALIEIVEKNCIRIEQFPPYISEIPKKFSNMEDENYKNQHILFRELME